MSESESVISVEPVEEFHLSDDKNLERLATEEILREASRGAVRAEAVGPSGWLKCPLPKTNKIFLKNTIRHAVISNNCRNRDKSKRLIKTSLRDLSKGGSSSASNKNN